MERGVVHEIADRLERYHRVKVPSEICPDDGMLDPDHPAAIEAYMYAGSDAIDIIATSMILNSMTSAPSVLDLPCGFGRVTRHLRAFLPDSSIFVADLEAEGTRFCQQNLGVAALEASEDFDSFDLGRSFDLIWSGSLLTHFDRDRFIAALHFFARSLTPRGIAIVTLHGRHSLYVQHHLWHYLSDKLFAIVEKDFNVSGFGYVDYENQSGYGISVSAPSFVIGLIEQMPGVRILGYHERRWTDHQDVLVFARTGSDD